MNNQFINMWNNMLVSVFGSYVNTPMPKYRKKSDTTKLTQVHYDFIKFAHKEFKQWNVDHPKDKKSTEELKDIINEKMELDKSVAIYSRVWCGHVDRDTLAAGTKYFDY